MTETTKTRSPEFRLAAGAIGGLRQDLFHDAFAYRPLAPMRTDGALTRRLSERMRARAARTPHALVGLAALITALIGLGAADGPGPWSGFEIVLAGLLPALTVAMTLFRPVGAFWMSMALTPVTAVITGGDWPWVPSMFFSHLVVLVVVAARTRPRTAAWMWVLTVVLGTFLENVGWHYSSTTGPMAVASAFALLVVTVVQTRREAEREVTVQRTVTAVERDRRTLLEERTTIARELHDVVAHHMSVVAIQAEAAPYRVENPPPELEQAFVTIRENAVAALTELRRVLGVVRAEDYEAPDAPQPTLAQLDGLLANVADAGLVAEKTVTGAVRELPQGVELSAYRIIQEALSNTLRHAPGATAKVEIGYVLGGLGLRVVNGPPTGPVKPSPGAGHGITGMRERVAMLNGEMTAETTGDGGYEIAVFIPVALAQEPTQSETS
ncbi:MULTISPECIES: sensor histidine kinase [Streptomyces]|uniref:sensor histidine kinase n=1 Tax=unclassified Streptomyces TaxID=2593676 RepID=UPI0008923E87|nr:MULTISPECIES: histidine kinase [unclassified Streptomyces]MDX2731538.1 histidine kinase [Streptomyces sp. PA03-2a]MDX3766953.1 histidine kinase [Streptomyces sp. AK08-01B]MDX3820334.1 histidine kinase [Streptomyces sp. AK08-01A]SCY71070.1 Signal transduction histidine kinase [Streptomyces sp. 136MFCol5.1]SFT31076.1 Signal transduction histidine kinase [Streptomyces sp. ok210]